jgi:hypothetical protein
MITGPRIDELLARAYTLTLGDVAMEMANVLPTGLSGELRKTVDARNFLAHHFWFERAHRMFRVEHVQQLIAELDDYREQFERIDKLVSEWTKPKLLTLGLTPKQIEDSERRILAGEPDDPLPDKLIIRELQKKLKKTQRLVNVWNVTTDQGLKSLIFELADGTLWQLCDVGLGLTRFQKVDSSWTEHPAIRPHLPADIVPRPSIVGSWEYEFTLGNGAVLWVKPGRLKQTQVGRSDA